MPHYLKTLDDTDEPGVLILLLVTPRASRTRLVGEHDGRLKIQITAPPVEGKANAGIIKYFSKVLGVPRANVEIMSGDTGRRKTLRVMGVDAQHVLDACQLS